MILLQLAIAIAIFLSVTAFTESDVERAEKLMQLPSKNPMHRCGSLLYLMMRLHETHEQSKIIRFIDPTEPYCLEAMDDDHRHLLKPYFTEYFLRKVPDDFFWWLDNGPGKSVRLAGTSRDELNIRRVLYLNETQRDAYEVVVKDGLMFYKNRESKPLDTQTSLVFEKNPWIYVISTDERLYVGRKERGYFQHTSFFGGFEPILAAGILTVVKGKIRSVQPYSGHYLPTPDNLAFTTAWLKIQGVKCHYIVLPNVPSSVVYMGQMIRDFRNGIERGWRHFKYFMGFASHPSKASDLNPKDRDLSVRKRRMKFDEKDYEAFEKLIDDTLAPASKYDEYFYPLLKRDLPPPIRPRRPRVYADAAAKQRDVDSITHTFGRTYAPNRPLRRALHRSHSFSNSNSNINRTRGV